MKRIRYHHGDLRRELIDIALGVVESEGPEGVNLRSISSKAGVSRSAPYRHFPSRSHLMAAVAARGFAMLQAACSSAGQGTPEESVTRLCRSYLLFATKHPKLYGLMFDPSVFSPEVAPELRNASDNAFAELETVLKEFPDSGSVELSAGTVWAMVHGLAIILNRELIQSIGKGRANGTAELNIPAQIDHSLRVLSLGLISV